VLGMLYESLVHPVTVLSTLPSAGVGAVLALLFFRMDFSIIALIGVFLQPSANALDVAKAVNATMSRLA